MLDKNRVFFFKNTINNKNDNIEDQAELFRCIGDPTCLKIISLLAGNKELCVSDLTSILGVSMPAVSHQLKKLKSMGLVERVRDGQMICYYLAKNNITKMLKTILKQSIYKRI